MRAGTIPGLACLLMISVAVAEVRETEEHSLDFSSGGRISLENINGDIQISGDKTDEVKIRVQKKAGGQEYMDDLKVIIDADDDYIRIETRHPEGGSRWSFGGKDRSGSVSYDLTIPESSNLDTISTVNGSVVITGVSGTVNAETVNGDLNISNLSSNADLETVNGGIEAEFDSVGGSQRVSGEAVNGKLVFRLPANASARINAETVNGDIDAEEFELEAEKGFVGKELDGQIGSGEARISLETVNGSIRVVKK